MIETSKGLSKKALLLWLPIIIIATPYLLFILPQYVGIEAYIVESGSMAPEMPTGSVVYMKDVPPSEIEEGEVILFTPNESRFDAERITHRVVDIREGNYTLMFKTKGDANPSPDPGWTPAYNIQGERVFHMPYLGHLIEASRSPLFILVFVLVPSIFLMKGEIEKVIDYLSDDKSSRTPLAEIRMM